MLRIERQIFMGNGDHSLAYVGHVYSRLGRAFDVLNGIQQPPMCTDSKEAFEQYAEMVEDGEDELEDIAKEIFLALTGKKITRKVMESLKRVNT